MTIVLAAAISARAAAADPVEWIDDKTTLIALGPLAGGQVAIERHQMPYGSGYTYEALTAVWIPPRGIAVRRLLYQGPTMGSDARAVAGGLELSIGADRFADTLAVSTWRLDVRTRRFVAAGRHLESPYARAARAIVTDLRGGREAAALAALDQLGDAPDGQATIAAWWAAERMWAAWPAIEAALAAGRGAEARRELSAHVQRLAAADRDDLAILLQHGDLTTVPRCVPTRVVAGPRPDLAAMLRDAQAILGAGDAIDAALAQQLGDAIAAAKQRL